MLDRYRFLPITDTPIFFSDIKPITELSIKYKFQRYTNYLHIPSITMPILEPVMVNIAQNIKYK